MPAPNPVPNPPPHIRRFEPAHVVILAGVCAALHVGKLPPAIPALQQALGITLVQAGFLLSMVQLAGMSVGVAVGALADSLTPRRSMLIGLVVQAVAGAAGGFAPDVAVLMALRAAEGFGFLLVVLAAPALPSACWPTAWACGAACSPAWACWPSPVRWAAWPPARGP